MDLMITKLGSRECIRDPSRGPKRKPATRIRFKNELYLWALAFYDSWEQTKEDATRIVPSKNRPFFTGPAEQRRTFTFQRKGTAFCGRFSSLPFLLIFSRNLVVGAYDLAYAIAEGVKECHLRSAVNHLLTSERPSHVRVATSEWSRIIQT